MSLEQRLVDLGLQLENGVLTGQHMTIAWLQGPDDAGLCTLQFTWGEEVQLNHVRHVDLRHVVVAGRHLQRLVLIRSFGTPSTLEREILYGVLSMQGSTVRGCIPNATLEVSADGAATITLAKGGTVTIRGISRIELEEPNGASSEYPVPHSS